MHEKLNAPKLSPGLALHLLNPFARNWFGKALPYFSAWFNHSQATLPLLSAKQSKSLCVSQPPPLKSFRSSCLFFMTMILIQDLFVGLLVWCLVSLVSADQYFKKKKKEKSTLLLCHRHWILQNKIKKKCIKGHLILFTFKLRADTFKIRLETDSNAWCF